MTVAIALTLLEDARDELKALPPGTPVQEAIRKIGEALSEIREAWGIDDE